MTLRASLVLLLLQASCYRAYTISTDELVRLKKPDPLQSAPGAPREFSDFSTKVPAAPRAKNTSGKEVEIDKDTSIKLRTDKGEVIEGLQPFAFTLTGTAVGQPQILYRGRSLPLESIRSAELLKYDSTGTTAAWVAAATGLFLVIISTTLIATSAD